MANSIRTPKRGKTEYSRIIADAVDDEAWQRFRLSLKGKATAIKLQMLSEYLAESSTEDVEVRKIRVYNYHGALCRGGQLRAGVKIAVDSLELLDHIIH